MSQTPSVVVVPGLLDTMPIDPSVFARLAGSRDGLVVELAARARWFAERADAERAAREGGRSSFTDEISSSLVAGYRFVARELLAVARERALQASEV